MGKVAESSVTFPKFSTFLNYGGLTRKPCPCFSKNGIKYTGAGTSTDYVIPDGKASGYCSRGVWFTPQIGRCSVNNCTSCQPPSGPGRCSGFLSQCDINCCNKGYSDGTWVLNGW